MIPLHDDNPTSTTPVLTIAIIAACVLVFLWQVSIGPYPGQRVVYGLGLIPSVLTNRLQLPPELYLIPAELTLVTSMFLHGGFMHLAGNMLYLWIFGNNIEDALGKLRFIMFYLLCGLAAAAGQTLQDPGSQVPMIGASGAISGILGAYLLLYPRARVLVLLPLGFYLQLIRLPAVWVLGLWFVMQLVSSALAGEQGGGGVAWFAHIGGFLAGMALVPFMKRKGLRLLQPARGGQPYARRVRRW